MKNEKFPMLIFHDKKYADQLNAEIASAKTALQKLLDCWNGLELPPLHKPLFELAHVPLKVYKEAVSEGVTEPVNNGRYELKPGVSLNVPDTLCPDELYRRARDCRNQIQTGRPELWSIENDKTVVLNEKAYSDLIHLNDIWAENENQAHFADLCVKYVQYSNDLNEALKGIQTLRMPAVPFQATQRSFPLIASLHLEVDQLKEIIKSM
jgi:hypothetical protein